MSGSTTGDLAAHYNSLDDTARRRWRAEAYGTNLGSLLARLEAERPECEHGGDGRDD